MQRPLTVLAVLAIVSCLSIPPAAAGEVQIGGRVLIAGNTPLPEAEVTLLPLADPLTDARRAMDGEGTDPLIADNTITAEGRFHAVTAWGGARPEIRGNTISAEQDGVNVRDRGFPSNDTGPWPTIVDNTITGAQSGISVLSGAGADIMGNTLEGNRIGIGVAISDATVDGNTVTDGRAGIVITGGSPTVRDNTVEGTDRGLTIGRTATPMLEGNTVCGNTTNLAIAATEMPDLSDNEICADAPTE